MLHFSRFSTELAKNFRSILVEKNFKNGIILFLIKLYYIPNYNYNVDLTVVDCILVCANIYVPQNNMKTLYT